MKIIFAFAVSLFAIQMATAQTTFQTFYPVEPYTSMVGFLTNADAGTLVVSWRPSYCKSGESCKAYCIVKRFANDGSLLWNYNYKTDISFSQPQGVVTKDSGFVLFGRLYDSAAKNWKGGLLMKCNKKGTLQWSKQIVSKKYTAFEPQVVGEDNNGNYVLFYTVANDNYSSAILQVVKISSTGKLIWSRTFDTYSSGQGSFHTIHSFSQVGNRYYVAGNDNCQICEGLLEAQIFVMDTSGNILKSKAIIADPNTKFNYNTDAYNILIKDGTAYIVGTYSHASDDFKYLLFPLRDTTTIDYGKLVGNTDLALQYQLTHYKPALLPANVYGYYSYKKDSTMLKWSGDAKGNLSVLQYYKNGRICPDFKAPQFDSTTSQKIFYVQNIRYPIVKDSVHLQDKALVVSAGSMAYTLICSSNSKITQTNESLTAMAVKHQEESLFIYPNPAGNTIHVNGLQSGSAISIFSSIGDMVMSATINSASSTINISRLKSGVYFIKIVEKGNSAKVMSFIKQ